MSVAVLVDDVTNRGGDALSRSPNENKGHVSPSKPRTKDYPVQTAPPWRFPHVESPIAFLDRDGVLNLGKAGYVNRPEEVELLKVRQTVASSAGLPLCVVTNQSLLEAFGGLTDLNFFMRPVKNGA